MARYCVGPAMAGDWGQGPPARLERRMVARVGGYFRPYWRKGATATGCLAARRCEVLSRIDNDVGGIQEVASDTVLGWPPTPSPCRPPWR